MAYEVVPIGFVRSPRKDVDDDYWGAVEAEIELADDLPPEAFAGLASFSHVEIIFLMHQVDPGAVEKGARHPRERTDWPLVGIFAQRGKARPNRLGLSRACILGIDGRVLRVRGLDAVDGTPVLDIKPWMAQFGPIGAWRQPAWADEIMRDYYKD